MVRVLLTGSRTWVKVGTIYEVLDDLKALHGADNLTIVHGKCNRGADAIAETWCRTNGVADEPHPADWKRGRHAGLLRNKEMVDSKPESCVAFIRNRSSGATGCADLAQKNGIPTIIYRHDG